MAGVTGLSSDESEVFEIMKSINIVSDTKFNDDLVKWTVDAFQAYITAGCDQQQLVDRLPDLLRFLRLELESTAQNCRSSARMTYRDQRRLGSDRSREVAAANAQANAADHLLERLDTATQGRLTGREG